MSTLQVLVQAFLLLLRNQALRQLTAAGIKARYFALLLENVLGV